MVSKKEILESITQETAIINHLAGKLSQEHLSYKPSEAQRSLLEVLRYLTVTALSSAKFIVSGNWEHAETLKADSEKVTLESFAEAMEKQVSEIKLIFADYDDETLSKKETSMPFGTPIKAGAGIVNMCLAPLTAYRMQLFLYAKATGLKELNSMNCWAGVDPQ